MKKIVALVLFFVVNLFSFTGCDPVSYFYNYEDLCKNVTSVELINYDNADAKELFERRDRVKAFDFSKMDSIDTLSEENKEAFFWSFQI